MQSQNYLADVREQYEDYPYPERNPEEERLRLVSPKSDGLDQLNYYCFEGKRDFSKEFRVLVAGGGTGDSAIFFAEQLRDTGHQVVYLDISDRSMRVAQQRAKMRGLSNIRWVHGSLLDLPRLDIGTFDYINSSGVLHHLEDPGKGLYVLNSALNDDGAMMIMVYAKYGRTAVYQIQELMRLVNADISSMSEKVKNCQHVLDCLPDTNWFEHLKKLFPHWEFKRPIELYDLFLHASDRAYSVEQLYDFVESSGLQILSLLPSGNKLGGRLYRPDTYIKDKHIIAALEKRPLREQQAIGELLNGGIPVHTFYAARHRMLLPVVDDLDNIPVLDMYRDDTAYESLRSIVSRSGEVVAFTDPCYGYKVRFPKTEHCEDIFNSLDGRTTLGTIFQNVASMRKNRGQPCPWQEDLVNEFKVIFQAFTSYNMMFLRNKNVPKCATIAALQRSAMGENSSANA